MLMLLPGLQNLTAQTILSGGDIGGVLSPENSPYICQGELTVPADSTLLIEAGVSILFEGNYGLTVYGRILAQGTTLSPIVFSANDTLLPWGGLKFSAVSPAATDSSLLLHCIVSYASKFATDTMGGGIFLDNFSHLRIESCQISHNRAMAGGGGIACLNGANPLLLANDIRNNHARLGGGIFLDQSDPYIQGLYLVGNVAADFGGGIAFSHGASPVFDTNSGIYLYNNYAAAAGTDLYAFDEPLQTRHISIDTFTVAQPEAHFAAPIAQFDLVISHAKIQQQSEDLYVSPDGSDENSGLSFATPLQTILAALQRIQADSLHPRVIHLGQGDYSGQGSGQAFPLNMRSHISVAGDNSMMAMISGPAESGFFRFSRDKNAGLSNMSLSGGTAPAGGAILIENSDSILLENLLFDNNTALFSGGAVFSKASPGLRITNCGFSFNNAHSGGAVYACSSPDFSISNSIFLYNTAASQGGAFAALAIPLLGIKESSFYGNTALTAGACLAEHCNLQMQGLSFGDNVASNGNAGGLQLSGSTNSSLEKSTFFGNNAMGKGSAIVLNDSAVLQLQNCMVNGNASGDGSSIAASKQTSLRLINTLLSGNNIIPGSVPTLAGTLQVDSALLEVYNCTLADNFGAAGGPVAGLNSSRIIKNSIVWNNIPGLLPDTTGNTVISYSDIAGGWTGTANISSDPLFLDAALGDYSLSPLSPCINTADPDTTGLSLPLLDLNDNPRIAQGIPDMGAIESFYPVVSENVSGHLVYGNSAHPTPLSNCTVKLQQGTTVVASCLSDSTGYYLFTNMPAGVYTIKVSSTSPWGGINSTDALLILKHFVGLNVLQGLLLKAGNVDGSASINAIDAQLIAKRFVGLISSFSIGDWVFETPQLSIPQTGQLDIIIQGVCSGDVNASYLPPN